MSDRSTHGGKINDICGFSNPGYSYVNFCGLVQVLENEDRCLQGLDFSGGGFQGEEESTGIGLHGRRRRLFRGRIGEGVFGVFKRRLQRIGEEERRNLHVSLQVLQYGSSEVLQSARRDEVVLTVASMW